MVENCQKCYPVEGEQNASSLKSLLPYIPHNLIMEGALSECCFFDSKIKLLKGVIVFIDMVGFTTLVSSISENGTSGYEKIQILLTDYYNLLIGAINSYGGTTYQFAGDSIIACFPQERIDPVDLIVKGAISAMAQISEGMSHFRNLEIFDQNYSINCKIGMSYGDYTLLLIGTRDNWMTPTIVGDPVNQAIEAINNIAPGETAVSKEMTQLLPDDLKIEISENKNTIEPKSYFPPEYGTSYNYDLLKNARNLFGRLSVLIKPALREKLIFDNKNFFAEHREVTCLMLHFTGINYKGDIQNATSNLDSFYQSIQNETSRFGGVLLQVDLSDKGNVFFVLFGAFQAQEKKELLAIELALSIMETRKRFNFITAIDIGIATGNAYCGNVGAEFRKDYTVIGPVINYASRLMTYSHDSGIYIDSYTESKVVHNFVKDKIKPVYLKGFDKPQSIYKIITKIKRYRGRKIKYKYAMYGRDEELNLLRKALQDSIEEKGNIICLTGEAGIGKTRLIESILDELRNYGSEPSIGHCYQYEQTTFLYPWIELLQYFFQIFNYQDKSIRYDNIKLQYTATFGSRYSEWIPYISNLLGVNVEIPETIRTIEPQERDKQLFSIILQLLQNSAKQTPLVLVLEDINWCDQKSIEFIKFVSSKISNDRILLILTSREDQQLCTDMTDSNIRYISLKPLDQDNSLKLLHEALPLINNNRSLDTNIVNKSAGNPLFIESIAYSLIEYKKVIPHTSGKYKLIENEIALSIPPTIHELMLSRIDGLTQQEQMLLKCASVIGQTFTKEQLKVLLPREISDDEMIYILNKMVSNNILVQIYDTPPTWLFKNLTLREIIYGTLLHSTKRELHFITALNLEKDYPANTAITPEVLSHHFMYGFDHEKALYYALISAEKCSENYALTEAVTFYQRAQRLALYLNNQKIDKQIATIKLKLADSLRKLGRFPEAELLLVDLEKSGISSIPVEDIYIGLGYIYQETGEPEKAEKYLEQALNIHHKNLSRSIIIILNAIWTFLFHLIITKMNINAPEIKIEKKNQYSRQANILSILNKIYILQHPKKLALSALSLYITGQKIWDKHYITLAIADLTVVFFNIRQFWLTRKCYNFIFPIIDKTANQKTKATLLSRVGFYNLFHYNLNESISAFNMAIDIFNKTGEQWELLSSFGGLGQAYFLSSKYNLAESCYISLGDEAVIKRSPTHLAWMYSQVAICRFLTGKIDFEIAREMLLISIDISKERLDYMNLCRSYGILTWISMNNTSVDEVAELALTSWEYAKKYRIFFPHVKLALLESIQGCIYALTHESTVSKKKLIKCIEWSLSKLKDDIKYFKQIEGIYLVCSAEYLHYKGKHIQAKSFYTSGIEILKNGYDKWRLARAYQIGARLFPEEKEKLENLSDNIISEYNLVSLAKKK